MECVLSALGLVHANVKCGTGVAGCLVERGVGRQPMLRLASERDQRDTNRQGQSSVPGQCTAAGDAVNLAPLILGVAEPGQVLAPEDAHRLIEGYFFTQPLGERTLSGRAAPVKLHQIIRARETRTRIDVGTRRGLTPFVGRTKELALLQERFAEAQAGRGQIVLLAGPNRCGCWATSESRRDGMFIEMNRRKQRSSVGAAWRRSRTSGVRQRRQAARTPYAGATSRPRGAHRSRSVWSAPASWRSSAEAGSKMPPLQRTCRPDGALGIWVRGCYKHAAPMELPNGGSAARDASFAERLSLTPRFSGVKRERWSARTVLTVFSRACGQSKTVKTVGSVVRASNTPLKRSVNETPALA